MSFVHFRSQKPHHHPSRGRYPTGCPPPAKSITNHSKGQKRILSLSPKFKEIGCLIEGSKISSLLISTEVDFLFLKICRLLYSKIAIFDTLWTSVQEIFEICPLEHFILPNLHRFTFTITEKIKWFCFLQRF